MGNCRLFGISGYWGLASDILDDLKVKDKTDRTLFKTNLLAEFKNRGLTEDLFSYLNKAQVKGFRDHFVGQYNSTGSDLSSLTSLDSLQAFLSLNCNQQIVDLVSDAQAAKKARDQVTERTPIVHQW